MPSDSVSIAVMMAFVVLDVLYPFVAICTSERRGTRMTSRQYYIDMFLMTGLGVAVILGIGWYTQGEPVLSHDPLMVVAAWIAGAGIAFPISDWICARMVYRD